MPHVWLQILPYTSAISSLIGETFNIQQLRTYEGVAPLQRRLAAFVVEILTILAVCALTAEATRKAGVVRGTLVGGLSTIVAYILPRMFLNPVVSRLCKSCNAWGKFAIGFCTLFGLFLIMLTLNWVLTTS